MIVKINSAAINGLEAIPVEVEVDISRGLPGMTVVGLGDKAIDEAKERVRSALKNSGSLVPAKKITVNLAPADIRKEGSAFDLPIAVGVLAAEEIIDPKKLKKSVLAGELALNGELRHIPGVLAFALRAKKDKKERIFVPMMDAQEAAVVKGIDVLPVESLAQLIGFLKEEVDIKPEKHLALPVKEDFFEFDFAYVSGQGHAKRALEIAAAGGHNVLMSGPPGSGKTLLARCLPSILPELTLDERLTISRIYSVSGILDKPLIDRRPFRSPHHTTSSVAMVGGGSSPKPGEITLAHLGVLFLDELPEFPRSVLEALRQPLEDGTVTVSRAQRSLRFPADFTLIAAQNPCPCGYATDPVHQCNCTASQISRYQRKISGPLLDRIDIHIEVPRLGSEVWAKEAVAEKSRDIRKRVEKARSAQRKRYKADMLNSSLTPKKVKEYLKLDSETKNFLLEGVDKLNLSARAYSKILKTARTIADLAGESSISKNHIAEALNYRPKQAELL